MNSAMQARIKTADRAHNVNSRELFGAVALFEQRCVHHGAFEGAGGAERVVRRSRPRAARKDLIFGDLSAFDRDVVSHGASNAFPETYSDGFQGRTENS